MQIKLFFQNKRVYKLLLMASFLIIWLFLFWRVKYGHVSNDEAFYITLGDRYSQGDYIIRNEWHRAMLSGLLELPIVLFNNVFFHNSEGIILHYRYLFILSWGLFSFFVFIKLSKYSFIGSYFCSIMILLYAPFGISAFSYNTFSQFFFITVLLLLMENSGKKCIYYCAGILFSLAVLAIPHLSILFFMQMIILIFKKNANKDTVNKLIIFIYGIITVFIIFIIYLFSSVSIYDIIDCIPYILNDPEIVYNNIFLFPIDYLKAVIDFNYHKKIIIMIYFFLYIICLTDKNKFNNKGKYLFCSIIICIIDLFFSMKNYVYINNLVFPLSMLGPIFLLYDDSRIKTCFHWLWMPGMLFSIVLFLSSDTGFHAISSGSLIASVAVVMMGFIAIEKNCKPSIKISFILLVSIAVMLELSSRYTKVFGADGIENSKYFINKGIEKGLYVNKYRYNSYIELNNDIENCSIPDNANVLFLSKKTWLYLINDSYNYSTYSAWLSTSPEKLIPYYEINENKMPDFIYADEDYFEILDVLIDRYDYTCVTTKLGNKFCYKNE